MASSRYRVSWLTDHQGANCRPMIAFIVLRQLLVWSYRADVPTNIVSSIMGLLVLDGLLYYYRSTNLRFIKARPILSLYELLTGLQLSIFAHELGHYFSTDLYFPNVKLIIRQPALIKLFLICSNKDKYQFDFSFQFFIIYLLTFKVWLSSFDF